MSSYYGVKEVGSGQGRWTGSFMGYNLEYVMKSTLIRKRILDNVNRCEEGVQIV